MSKTPISVRLEKILNDEVTVLYKYKDKWCIGVDDGEKIDGDTLDEVIGNYFAATKPKRRNRQQDEGRVDNSVDTNNG